MPLNHGIVFTKLRHQGILLTGVDKISIPDKITFSFFIWQNYIKHNDASFGKFAVELTLLRAVCFPKMILEILIWQYDKVPTTAS